MSDDERPGFPQLGDLLQTAQRMQQEIGRVQQQLATKTVEGSAGGGMVIATVNGRQQLVSIHVEPQIVDPQEIEMLQDLIVAATNQALSKAAEMTREELAAVTGGLPIKIPGLL